MTQIKNIPLVTSCSSTDTVVGDVSGVTKRIRIDAIARQPPTGLAARNFANDAAAAAGGVAVGAFYHTSGTVKVRLV